jgi:hypothetical protein
MTANDHRIDVRDWSLLVLVLGETIALREIVGALVIGRALLVIDGRVFRLVRGAASPSTSR